MPGVTTIRDELATGPFGPADYLSTLVKLGIDPDLPAEWATVDRCLRWLNDRRYFLAECRNDTLLHLRADDDRQFFVRFIRPGIDGFFRTGPTLHAALAAACRAVQDGENDG